MTIEILDPKKITLVQWAILATCFACKMLEGFANVIIAYTAPAISRDWGISPEELGVVFSAGLAGMTIGAMFIASLADIYGRRLVAAMALILTGSASLVVFYIDSLGALIATRVLAGIGIGTLMAVLTTLGGEYSPKTWRNFMLAAFVSASSMGSVVGGIVTSAWLPEYGWRSLYLCSGLLTVIAAVLFLAVVPESVAHLISRKSSDSLEDINRILAYIRQKPLDSLPHEHRQAPERASVTSLLTPRRRSMTLIAWTTFFAAYAGMYFIVSWLPKLLVDSGIPESESIQAVVILTLGSTIGALSIGWISRWWQLNRLIASSYGLAALLILVFSVVLSQFKGAPVLTAWSLSLLIGITLLGAFSNMYAVVLSIYPDSIRITGLGWCIGLGRSGAIASPVVAGVLLGIGVTSSEVLAWSSVTVLLAAVGILLVKVEADH